MNFLLRNDADQGSSFTIVYQFRRVHVMSFNLWWFINDPGSKSLFVSFLFGITRNLGEIENQGILQADLCNFSVMWRKCVFIVVLIAGLELQGKLRSDINYEYWSLIAIQQFLGSDSRTVKRSIFAIWLLPLRKKNQTGSTLDQRKF